MDDAKINFTVPKIPKWDRNNEIQDLEILNNVNHDDLTTLNKALVQLSKDLNKINEAIKKTEDYATRLDMQYKHNFRDLVIHSEYKTDSQKKMYAEIACEELEYQLVYYKMLLGQQKRYANTVRLQLDIIQTIGNNVRKEMGMA